jgi:hypothetical protein
MRGRTHCGFSYCLSRRSISWRYFSSVLFKRECRKTMDADWQIIPRRGIGRLTFVLSAEEISAMAETYGEPSPFCSHADTASHLEAVIAQYGSTLSAEDIATMRRGARGSDAGWPGIHLARLSRQSARLRSRRGPPLVNALRGQARLHPQCKGGAGAVRVS